MAGRPRVPGRVQPRQRAHTGRRLTAVTNSGVSPTAPGSVWNPERSRWLVGIRYPDAIVAAKAQEKGKAPIARMNLRRGHTFISSREQKLPGEPGISQMSSEPEVPAAGDGREAGLKERNRRAQMSRLRHGMANGRTAIDLRRSQIHHVRELARRPRRTPAHARRQAKIEPTPRSSAVEGSGIGVNAPRLTSSTLKLIRFTGFA